MNDRLYDFSMPKPARAPAAPFGGLPKSAMQFFPELTIEMNREWFEANKARYQTEATAEQRAAFEKNKPAD